MDQPKLNAVVTLRNHVSPWLMILQVAADGWDLPDFAPGQYICLGLYASASRCEPAKPEAHAPAPDKLIQRAYSIASSPLDREFMEFYLNLVPAGVLTPRLFNLKMGDRVWLSSRATGSFTSERVPESANVVLIANGSGPCTVCQHADHSLELPQTIQSSARSWGPTFLRFRLPVSLHEHAAP